MIDNVLMIAPEAAPGSGGVADYSLRLMENLRGEENVRLLVLCERSQLPPDACKVIVQYSAYGFDRFGYPRDLIRALINWKTKTRGRMVVMFHEIWTFWPWTNKNFLVQLLHRRAIQRLLHHVDFAFTSTSGQAEHLRGLRTNTPIQVLPVGSNIRCSVDLNLPRERACAVIFGRADARLRALNNMHRSLSLLAAAKAITKIISVGTPADPQSNAAERHFLTGLQLPHGFQQLDGQDEPAVSKILAKASLGIFGQNELSYAKSGSFMAYAAHGLNVLADFADPSKPPPIRWLVSPGELIQKISPAELNKRARLLRTWQEQTSSWELIGATFSKALQLGASERVQIASR